MVQPIERTQRTSSSSSTATCSSVRSSKEAASSNYEASQSTGNGTMASAAAFSRSRRDTMLKHSSSQPSMHSVASTSTAGSAAKKGRDSPQPRSSFGTYVERAREAAKTSTGSPSTKRGGYATAYNHKAKRRSAQTVMQSGRHGNEWLFNGWSLRETVKGLLK